MMENIHQSDEKYIILDNKNKEDKLCQFEVTFADTIDLKQPYECAILQATLPNKLYVNQFPKKYKIFLHMVWIKSFNVGGYKVLNNEKYYDQESSQDYEKSKTVEIEIGPNLKSHQKILQEFENVIRNPKIFEELSNFYKKRFSKASLSRDAEYKIIWPEISYKYGRFENKDGCIKYTGITEDFYKEYSPKYNAEFLLYYAKKKDFFKDKNVFLYLTFDRELHELLGFDPEHYPNITIYDVGYVHKLQISNEGLAKYRVNFDWFDPLYIYSNIIQDTYCGNIKKNILKVIARKSFEEKEVVDYNFDNLMFIPLRIKEIHSIKISCSDSLGQIPTYDRGHISLSLLLRPLYNHGSI